MFKLNAVRGAEDILNWAFGGGADRETKCTVDCCEPVYVSEF